LHRSAEVDFDGLENEGNTPRSEERISLGGPAKLLANGTYPTYAASLEEAKISDIINVLEGIMVSPDYGLFPEASSVKPTVLEVCAALFRCR